MASRVINLVARSQLPASRAAPADLRDEDAAAAGRRCRYQAWDVVVRVQPLDPAALPEDCCARFYLDPVNRRWQVVVRSEGRPHERVLRGTCGEDDCEAQMQLIDDLLTAIFGVPAA